MKKLRSIALLIMACFGFHVGAAPIIVDDPDLPESGWYWQPQEGGWGLNCTIQPANFAASGQFVFCAIFTYDEDGNPKWYTMSGEYVPNPDVYAWREGRGPMGTFVSPLYESQGGACPTCQYVPPATDPSALGSMTIEWDDPLNGTMTIGGVQTPIVYQYYHAGLQANNADFITDGAWYIQAAFHKEGYKGLITFSELDLNTTADWDLDGLTLDPDIKWYMSSSVTRMFAGLPISDPDSLITAQFGLYSVLLGYNTNSNQAHLFSLLSFDDSTSVVVCGFETVESAKGILKPAVSSNSRFYYSQGELDNCDPTTLSLEQQRQIFVSMTRIPQGGSDMATLPAFQNLNYE